MKPGKGSSGAGRLGAAACLLAVTSFCYSQSAVWKPEANVELIVPAGAGGSTDVTLRTIRRIMVDNRFVSTPVTVINKPGGSNAIAYAYMNQHPGDGHYLSLTTINLLTNRITGTNLLSHADVTPIAHLYNEYIAFVVRADSPLRTGRDMVERLKANPESLSISLATSRGGANHIAAGMVLKAAGGDPKKLKIVVFDAAGKVMTALLGGHIDVMAGSASSVVNQLKAGTVKVIAMSSPQRLDGVFASVGTWKEQGVNAVFANWRGISGPRGLAPAAVSYWEQVLEKAMQSEDWKQEVARNYAVSAYLNSRETKRFLDAQNEELKSILLDLGMVK